MPMLKAISNEPYRLLFPVGFLFLLTGVLLWSIVLWDEHFYPVNIHRYLVINGFVYSFIAGFLFTAVPQFSGTFKARLKEIFLYLGVTIAGLTFFCFEEDQMAYIVSALQSAILLVFILIRIKERTQNPPFTFIFIFVGLALNSLLGIERAFEFEWTRNLSDFLPITFIIMGVGGRLIPGILGHVDIVSKQREIYETEDPLYKLIPISIYLGVILMVGSFFIQEDIANIIYCGISVYWGIFYCKLYKFPQKRSSLAWGVWLSTWCIVIGFLSRYYFIDGGVHLTHTIFIGSFVVLTFMIATRVLQAHGCQNKEIENSKTILVVLFFSFLAMTTRVSVLIFPDLFFSHLAYSAMMLLIAAVLWGIKYLPQVFVIPNGSLEKE